MLTVNIPVYLERIDLAEMIIIKLTNSLNYEKTILFVYNIICWGKPHKRAGMQNVFS